MKTFYAVCIIVILVLSVITMVLRSESTSFYGIADAQEIVINDEYAVEIMKIHVVPGQKVSEGDTIVEVKRPELDLKIAELSRELAELRKQTSTHATLTNSEMLQLKSKQEMQVNELRGQIRELEAELETNRKLVSELRSIKKGAAETDDNSDMSNPIVIKIQQLKKALELALDTSNIGVNRLSNELSYQGGPLVERSKGLQKELNILMEAKQQSSKISQISGIIGSVCFKVGEKVSPFTPICSLHTESPSFIRGYIHENAYSQVLVGQMVRVSSLANKHFEVAGEVVGVGSRIVEYPVRLRKNPEVQMWGREITIRIPSANKFLLGERVLISLLEAKDAPEGRHGFLSLLGGTVYAQERSPVQQPVQQAGGLRAITGAAGMSRIEASGIVYCSDLDKYLVISDETEKNSPLLYLMNPSGSIEQEVRIAGLEKIDDMEGIAAGDSGCLYVLSSQSVNKKGKISAARKLFLKVRRNGSNLTLKNKIELSDFLVSAAGKTPEKPWSSFFLNAVKDSTLDIEGVAFRQGALYLGVKNPLLNGSAVIIRIGNADRLFAAAQPADADIRLWNSWKLSDPIFKAPGGISDLFYNNDTLFLLSVAHDTINGTKQTAGILWQYRPGGRKPGLIRRFPGLKPEGITRNSRSGELIVVFDNGSARPPQMVTMRVGQ